MVIDKSESGTWKLLPIDQATQVLPGLMIYRFTHSMYYANSEWLSEQVLELSKSAEPPLKWFCFDASAIDDVDYSAAETLRSLYAQLKEKDIRLVVAQVLDDVKEESRYNLISLFGEDAYYDSLDDVVEDYKKKMT